MAIVTRGKFASLCNKTVATINTNINRGKLNVCSDDSSLIDTEDALNNYWMKDQRRKDDEKVNGKQPPPAAPQIETLYKEVVQKVEEPKTKKTRASKKEVDQADEMLSWDARKKRADALKAESQAEKEALAVQKMMGQLMPTELVEQIFRINIQSVFKEFEAGCLNIASTYCDTMAGGDRTLLGKVTEDLRDKLTDIIDRSKESAEIEIENAINEYAETRSRGERK